jgi:hypothetical protein
MARPSQPFNPQSNCLMFQKLPAEVLDQIYALVFTVETSEDGSIELNATTQPPYKDLTLTCQKLRNETRAMYRAAYQSFPNHTFTVDMNIRSIRPVISRELDNFHLTRINSYRIAWSHEHKKTGRMHFTTHMDRDAPGQKFRTWVTRRIEDDSDSTAQCPKAAVAAVNVIREYPGIASAAIEKFNGVSLHWRGHGLHGVLAWEILCAVWDPRWKEVRGFCVEKSTVVGIVLDWTSKDGLHKGCVLFVWELRGSVAEKSLFPYSDDDRKRPGSRDRGC